MHSTASQGLVSAVAGIVLSLCLAGCTESGSEPISSYSVAPEPDSSSMPYVPATSVPPASDPERLPVTAVPPELVGEWDGDRADYSFASNGQVGITGIGQGTVEIAGNRIAFHVPGIAPWSVTWRVGHCADPAGYGYSYRMLWLDDVTYVADC